MKILIFLLLIPGFVCQEGCGVASSSTKNAPNLDDFEFGNDENRLIGGLSSHMWPWMVQLTYNGRHKCGGVLIDREIVLTAAHCFKNLNPDNFKVLAGGYWIHTGRPHKIVQVKMHALYNIFWAQSYDIALVKIQPPIEISNRTSTICLPKFNVPDRQICWGALGEEGSVSPNLREIHVPIMPIFECNNDQHYAGRIHLLSMICAGYSQGKVDSCHGDSGGPLMCGIDGRWEVHGIVSWGVGCGRRGFPGVYASVNAAKPWIELEMIGMRSF
ncbi:hypothetical protein WR25_05999 isoform A [Diploscapter pachys]|uniref:Peptidase S1 domain-containing protein n=2 Tax=Diploscapter pachys TaxID=2018661 RepID=A0A2A2LQI9_9BILA|nr:hypothetical protein WR25_05999 isoform A [Diploscapter pachys]